MTMPAQLQADCDAAMAAMFADMKPKQDAYYAANKKYFQSLATPSAIPKDGATVTPDKDTKPSGQSESLNDFGVHVPVEVPIQFSTNTYSGIKGRGWWLEGRVISVKVEYVKRLNSGPHTEFGNEWE